MLNLTEQVSQIARVDEGYAFDLVKRMYESIGDSEKSELWQRNKINFLQPAQALVAQV